MAFEFTTRRVVEFADTDMAGIMHFSNYFRFMEVAEHGFFRSLGLSIHRSGPDRMTGWARVHAECSYRSPLRYQDTAEIELLVSGKTEKTISYQFAIRKPEIGSNKVEEVARGLMRVVYVTSDGNGTMQATRMPAEVDERVEVAPPERLGHE